MVSSDRNFIFFIGHSVFPSTDFILICCGQSVLILYQKHFGGRYKLSAIKSTSMIEQLAQNKNNGVEQISREIIYL